VVNFHPSGGAERWGVHNNSAINLERALVERVLTVKGEDGNQVHPPQPQHGEVKRRLKNFTRKFLHYTDKIDVLTTKEFVATYTGRKAKMYQAAAESLECMPLNRKDATISAFIKDEKTNLTRKDDPAPRIIQPRSPRFNVAIGCHLKPMEKSIFRGIARVFRSTTVMKGLNASERGKEAHRKWNRFKDPVAICLDAARFDQHVNRDCIDWEHSIQERLTSNPSELRRLNQMRKINRCYARTHDGAFKYRLCGTRMSGDMDTASANCMLMCAMTWSFMQWLGVSIFEYMNDGDDGVLFVERCDSASVVTQFKSYFLTLGFTMKLEGVHDVLEQVEFCQAKPIFDGISYRFVRDPEICFGKDSLSLRGVVDERSLIGLRNSVGWCGLSLAGDMPLFCEYYRSMVTSIDDKPPSLEEFTSGMQFLARGLVPKYSRPCAEARESFERAYGLSPDHQIAIEHELRSTDATIYHPAVQMKFISSNLQHLLLK